MATTNGPVAYTTQPLPSTSLHPGAYSEIATPAGCSESPSLRKDGWEASISGPTIARRSESSAGRV